MTKNKIKYFIDKLYSINSLSFDELLYLIENIDNEEYNFEQNLRNYLYKQASDMRNKHYGNRIYLRGLIELTNYCKNNCYYCGIQSSNKNIIRYRLSLDEILECCDIGYKIGYRTFVLQGGEDTYFNDDKICEIVSNIKNKYEDCAITLSLGEKSYDSYKKYFLSGADRYLLRHETATDSHYKKLHPPNIELKTRKECLKNLKEIGYQVGAGFMVESPFQTNEDLVRDLLYLKELNPHMVGIGPFIPHHDTIFKDYKHGDLEKTLLILSITRLLLPKVLLPATTALASINPSGRNAGLLAGCNVIMPNLSPQEFRKQYSLYDNKAFTGQEACEYHQSLEENIKSLGLKVDYSRGDNIEWRRL
ncbi:[FeFe] hydrogenase H-cluster radical SAM maturase HydE [Clostridioides difficile]|nr:[FeFe] hydrogenase H-cluster radical SAM maturase HydE [Clostridioides difficile]